MTDDPAPLTTRLAVLIGEVLDLLLVLAVGAVVVASAVFPGFAIPGLRTALGMLFVGFLPGYAVVSLLFPETGKPSEDGEQPSNDDTAAHGRGVTLTGVERLVLSFATSLAIVPLVGLSLWLLTRQIDPTAFLLSIAGVSICSTGIAAIRRARLRPSRRYVLPVDRWIDRLRSDFYRTETRTDLALNVLVAVSLVAAFVSVPYALWIPSERSSFTQTALLTENENGRLVAGDYPTEFTLGESKPVVFNTTNREHRRMNYSLIVELQRVASNGTVSSEETLRRASISVPPNATRSIVYEVRPTMSGSNLRLVFLLYAGSVPPHPTMQNSYRSVHIWISVSTERSQ